MAEIFLSKLLGADGFERNVVIKRMLSNLSSIPAVLARLLALAMPKSVSFTAPSKETRTLCGVTSRWTRPSG